MTRLDRDGWATLLAQLYDPALGQVAEALANARDLEIGTAYDRVEHAIDDGPLVEEGDGGLGTIRVDTSSDYAPNGGAVPLEQYEPKGYAYAVGDESEQHVAARDAAVALTASSWGPPVDTEVCEDTDPWGEEIYRCACTAVEDAIVDALQPSENDTNTDDKSGSGDNATQDVEEPTFPDANPREETGETGSSNAPPAFIDAIDYFHSQLDRDVDIPESDADTPREYLREERGWDDETIDMAGLGWAPASRSALLDHLMRQGYDREEILATGLFYENGLRPHFRGRIVFPYFGRSDEPVYAIARTVEHPDDSIDPGQKYIKAIKHNDYSGVDEPIYGLGSLDRDGPVVITEGVADAIVAHSAGYACLSPVTTQFKDKHREQLLEELGGTDRRVYVVQDAERPGVKYTEEADGWDALGLEQTSPGLKGGITTAAFLDEGGVDAYLAELPRLGLNKVDLDDYLGGWSDTLRPILSSAKPAEQHPKYGTVVGENGSPPGATDTTVEYDDVSDVERDGDEFSREHIEEALSCVSRTLHYDDWIQLGYAVHDWDDGSTGKQVFEQWS